MAVIPTITQCEEAIGEPAAAWKGRCHEIACAINDAGLTPGCVPRYGHYHGPIAPTSYFGGRSTLPPRHGWLEFFDGVILDPTLWVFLDTEPYIGIALPGDQQYDYYDIGGELLMSQLGKDAIPSRDEWASRGDMWLEECEIDWPDQVKPLLRRMFGSDENLIRGDLYHLANRGPQFLGDDAAIIYQAVIDSGRSGWIPIDYRTAVLGPPKEGEE